MAWMEWPFLLSQVIEQAIFWAFIVLGIVMLSGRLCFGQHARVVKTFPVLWLGVLIALALRESAFMLASSPPEIQGGASTVVSLLFVVLVLLYSFAEHRLIGSDKQRKGCLAIMVALCTYGVIHNMLSQGMALYSVVSAAVGGGLLAHGLFIKAQHKLTNLDHLLPRYGLVLGVVAFILQVVAVVPLIEHVEQGNPWSFIYRTFSLGTLVIAVGLWLMPSLTKSKPVLLMVVIASMTMLISNMMAMLALS